MRLIGFSSRRSCHEVTDEVKFCGLMSFLARHCVGRHDLMPPIIQNPRLDEIQPPPSRLRRAAAPKAEEIMRRFLFVQKFGGTVRAHRPTDCFCYEKNPPSVRRKDLIYLSEFYTELIFKCL